MDGFKLAETGIDQRYLAARIKSWLATNLELRQKVCTRLHHASYEEEWRCCSESWGVEMEGGNSEAANREGHCVGRGSQCHKWDLNSPWFGDDNESSRSRVQVIMGGRKRVGDDDASEITYGKGGATCPRKGKATRIKLST